MSRKTDKRKRLLDAAKILFHDQGIFLTTLADIAHAAGVPLGNVYYYFKKKEDIIEAVIEKVAVTYSDLLKSLDEIANPLDRLKSLLQQTTSKENLEQVARYGCQIAGLCQELSKQGGHLADRAAKLLHDLTNWAEIQFNAIGCGANSSNYALTFITAIQGGYLFTHTFKDPEFSIRQSDILLKWLEGISQTKVTKIKEEEEAFA